MIRPGSANFSLFFPIPGLEFGRRRLVSRGDILGEKPHLLRHPAPDDGVVLVEAHRQPFAIEDLLLDLVFNHAVEFVGGRRTLPLGFEVHVHLAQVVQRQRDLPGRLHAAAPAVHVAVHREQRQSRAAESAASGSREIAEVAHFFARESGSIASRLAFLQRMEGRRSLGQDLVVGVAEFVAAGDVVRVAQLVERVRVRRLRERRHHLAVLNRVRRGHSLIAALRDVPGRARQRGVPANMPDDGLTVGGVAHFE